LYMGTWDCRPVRLKSSSMKSSDTSAKYSWPRRLQNEDIHDSATCDEDDIAVVRVCVILTRVGRKGVVMTRP
jgi:hypothetical protein